MSEEWTDRLGYIISIGLHALLLMIFVFINIEVQPFVLEFTALNFAPMDENLMERGSLQQNLESGRPNIELPRRPMINETSPLLKLPDRNRPVMESLPPTEKPTFTDPNPKKPGLKENFDIQGVGTKARPSIKTLPLDETVFMPDRPDALSEKLASDEMFTIEWESGPKRFKTTGDLPVFPAGVTKGARVQLRFTITPDGSVTFAAPVTKGEPKLEDAALNALRKWQFSRLEKAQPQTNQTGVITFIFELK